MASPKRDAATSGRSPSSHPYFRLVIQLDDGRRKRSVSLDFDDRATIELQIRQLRRDHHDAAELYEFRNERGEMLAVLARAFADYDVLALRG